MVLTSDLESSTEFYHRRSKEDLIAFDTFCRTVLLHDFISIIRGAALSSRHPPSPSTPSPMEHGLVDEQQEGQTINVPELEAGVLYAVLTFRGDYTSWDWSFFVPDSTVTPIGKSGALFHIVNYPSQGSAGTLERWTFEMEPNKDVNAWPEIVAIVRLGDLSGLGCFKDVVQELITTFSTVDMNIDPVEMSTRKWFLDALWVLHDCGFVTCDDAWLLERELKKYAFSSMDTYLEAGGK